MKDKMENDRKNNERKKENWNIVKINRKNGKKVERKNEKVIVKYFDNDVWIGNSHRSSKIKKEKGKRKTFYFKTLFFQYLK